MHLGDTASLLLKRSLGSSAALAENGDTITAGSSEVTISGGAGTLSFVGGTGNVFVAIGSGSSTLFGGFEPRAAEFSGGSGNSTLLGGGSPTTLVDGAGQADAAAATGATTIGGNGTLTFEDTTSCNSQYEPRPA